MNYPLLSPLRVALALSQEFYYPCVFGFLELMNSIRMPSMPSRGRGRQSVYSLRSLFSALILIAAIPPNESLHHMQRAPLSWVNRRGDSRTLRIKNQCPEVIYPGIGTQAGAGPAVTGFKLAKDESRDLTVSADWQGRVWGRTNCSFNAAGTGPASSGTGVACGSGDCGGVINCRGTVCTDLPRS